MLTAVVTINFVPAPSATSHVKSPQPLFHSNPAVDVFSLRGAAGIGPRTRESEGISTTTTEAVTEASVMWGSFRPTQLVPNCDGRLIKTRTAADSHHGKGPDSQTEQSSSTPRLMHSGEL
jgi:hypothetical protein